MNVQGVVIDAQNDFCKPNGSLYVAGADEDMKRLAVMIDRIRGKIDDIHATLDSHHQIDIAHPLFWIDNDTGKSPNPFTIITVSDIEKGKYRTFHPGCMKRAIEYVKQLEINNRYPLCIWPVHCDIGSWGYGFHQEIYDAMVRWENERFAVVDKVTKGSNPWTEHYSAVQADVPDPNDPSTMLNIKLIQTLQEADIIFFAGEAASHCCYNTAKDIIDNFGGEHAKKIVLLEDCTSAVPGFESGKQDLINIILNNGGQVMKSTEFLI
jgi:nicotinamidase-related amidase